METMTYEQIAAQIAELNAQLEKLAASATVETVREESKPKRDWVRLTAENPGDLTPNEKRKLTQLANRAEKLAGKPAYWTVEGRESDTTRWAWIRYESEEVDGKHVNPGYSPEGEKALQALTKCAYSPRRGAAYIRDFR